jgi:hypothetical protein
MMTDAYLPTDEELKTCLHFLGLTMLVTLCSGDMEKKEVTTRGTGFLLTEKELIFENYTSQRFGSTLAMSGVLNGVNSDHTDFELTFTGDELNHPVTILTDYGSGSKDINVNGHAYPAHRLLALV